MDSNSWFYTLSAIPQTLAAMIALTATFVVYKLSRIKDYISRHTEEVKIFLPHLVPEERITDAGSVFEEEVAVFLGQGLDKMVLEKDDLGTEQFGRLMESFSTVCTQYNLHLEPTKENLYKYLSHKRAVIDTLIFKKDQANKTLRNSLLFTSVPIALSIFLLPFYSAIVYWQAVVIVMILITGLSVAYTAYTVWKISNL